MFLKKNKRSQKIIKRAKKEILKGREIKMY